MQRGGVVYIMASPNRGVLYVGVTADLYKRVHEHKHKAYPQGFTTKYRFTTKYNCVVLVYYRGFDRIEEAIAEEKRLKKCSRKYKEALVDNMNSEWRDLWEDVQHW